MLGARWADLELEQGIWTKPGHTTKQRTEHRVPLSAPALELLTAIRAIGVRRCRLRLSPAVSVATASISRSPGRRSARPPASPASACMTWAHLCEPVRERRLLVADDRRPARAHAAETTHRYAHLFDDPLRQATERVGAIITGKPGAEVRRLRK